MYPVPQDFSLNSGELDGCSCNQVTSNTLKAKETLCIRAPKSLSNYLPFPLLIVADLKEKNKRKDKLARNFSEGWIEFISKRVAKDVASNLNMTQVGGKKRSKSHDVNWNIKYLPG